MRQVNDIGDLHRAARLVKIREVENQSRQTNDSAEKHRAAPEPRLLAGVEPPGGLAVCAEEWTEVAGGACGG